jgi:hypothetical protein
MRVPPENRDFHRNYMACRKCRGAKCVTVADKRGRSQVVPCPVCAGSGEKRLSTK